MRRVNPESFHHEKNTFLLIFLYLKETMDVNLTYCGNHVTTHVSHHSVLLKSTQCCVSTGSQCDWKSSRAGRCPPMLRSSDEGDAPPVSDLSEASGFSPVRLVLEAGVSQTLSRGNSRAPYLAESFCRNECRIWSSTFFAAISMIM